MKKMYLLLPALLLVAVSTYTQVSGQPVIYVDSSVATGGNGSTWTNAYKSLATALNAANSNTSVQQVLVAKGTYYPTPTANADTSFVLARGGIKIYGGYPTGGAGARNITANPVILSGDISPTDRDSYHVMVIAGIPSNADSLVLDGLTIAKGASYLNSTPYVEDRQYNGVTVRTVTGSGIVLQGNASTKTAIRNCLFSENRSAQYGGGIYCKNASLSVISNCSFINNYSGIYGGAIYTYQSTATSIITNCIFSGNTGYNDGGSVYNLEAPSIVTGCTFTGNDAFNGSGGGMYNSFSTVIVTSCRFVGNTGFDSGGGMFNIDCTPAITNSVFVNNKVRGGRGGGLYNRRSSSPVINCIFYGNSCAQDGGAVYNTQSSSTNIVNSTFSANTAGTISGGSNLGGTIAASEGSVTIANCIVWGNNGGHPGVYNSSSSGSASVRYSIVQGTGVYSGTGNLNTDPQFLNAASPAGADSLFATADDGLKLQSNSPAINAGNNADILATGVTTDLTGATRIQAGTVDMGAYEYNPCPASTIVYVDSAKAASGDGSSWANAYKTLTEGLTRANGCTNITQLWVAKGTYQPSTNASFTMVPNVKIYGGFASGDISLSQRNFTANPTILKGNNRSVISNNNNGLSASAVLDGFTITGGNDGLGGGMSNASSSPTVTNCTFSANTAINGGGMFNLISSPMVTNCTFSANTAGNDGGGMYNLRSSPTVTNCTFSANTARGSGGGMLNYSSSPILTNCIIWGNTAPVDQQIFNSFSTPTVTYSIVQGGYSGTGNLDKDPLFVDAAAGNLRLQPCSPAINRGLNSANNQPTDIAGNNRIQFAIIDLGAYESPYDTIPAPRVTINANPGSTICAGTPVTFTATAVNGGTAPAYQWKKNGTIVSTNSTYSTGMLSNRDTITVTLTNATSCSYPLFAVDTLIVTVNPAPAKPTITANGSTTLCSGGSVTLTSSPAFAYRWSNGATTQSITVMQSGAYTVTVTSASGCTSPASDTTRVTATTLSAGNISISPVYTVNPGGNANTIYLGYGPQSVTLSSGTVTGGTAPYTYQWSPATGLNNPLTASSVTAHPVVTTTYTLTIKDRNGCSIDKTFTVNVIDARCGNKNDMVSVCHNGNTLCVSQNAVQAHLKHGDYVGACGAASKIVASTMQVTEVDVPEKAVSVYPNPSNGQFTVQLNNSSATKAEVQIVDAKGMVVEKKPVQLVKGSQTLQFNLANKASGLYLVKVIDEKGIQAIKMIVQR